MSELRSCSTSGQCTLHWEPQRREQSKRVSNGRLLIFRCVLTLIGTVLKMRTEVERRWLLCVTVERYCQNDHYRTRRAITLLSRLFCRSASRIGEPLLGSSARVLLAKGSARSVSRHLHTRSSDFERRTDRLKNGTIAKLSARVSELYGQSLDKATKAKGAGGTWPAFAFPVVRTSSNRLQ
jgi:hypothetical protein